MAPATLQPMASEEPMASEAPMASTSPVAAAVVAGTIVLPEGTTLPEDASIVVEVQDTSLADAPALIISQAEIAPEDPAATEIPFEVQYDEEAIEDTNTYTLSVRIEDAAGTLLFINDTSIPVITRDAPTTDVAAPVVVAPMAALESPTASEVPVEPSPAA